MVKRGDVLKRREDKRRGRRVSGRKKELWKGVVNFGGGGGVLECGEAIQSSAGCNLSSIPNCPRVDVGQKL